MGLISGLGRSLGGGNGNPLHHFCLENSMDREAWWAIVHGVTKSQTWQSTHTGSLVLQSLLKFMPIESVMLSNHLILFCPFLLLPLIFLSIKVFSNELTLHIRWPKYWSFSFSISPSKEYSGLISFKINCFDLLAFQGTLKSFLQHHSLKALILRHSAFFMIHLSHPYMTIGKIIVLSIWTLAGSDVFAFQHTI